MFKFKYVISATMKNYWVEEEEKKVQISIRKDS